MFCIIAFVVLAILGIFSATNRALAKEAFDCVLRRVTLRPCNTGFDEKMKAKILGTVIMRSERAAGFLSKYFELLSWIFFILMLASTIWAVRGLYLFYVTGSCNGLNATAFCVFDPTGSNNTVSGVTEGCPIKPISAKDLTLEGVNLTGFPVLNPNSPDKIVMVGCYGCEYTRKTYPIIQQMVKHYGANFTFLDYPVKVKSDYLTRVGYCTYQADPVKYWQLNDILFTADKSVFETEEYARKTLGGLGLDAEAVLTCVNEPRTAAVVKQMLAEVMKTKFYGTPTIFINGQVLVGPKPYRVYAILLKGLLFWLY
jgi:thiol-disulfide isomerase/thioredoxin